jgi:type III secretory pathway component EscU
MTEAKIHPPSRSRIAEARASGVLPRPLLIGVSAALLALSLFVRAFGPAFARPLQALLHAPLDRFAHGESAPNVDQAVPHIAALLHSSALALGAVAACVILGALLAQGAQFGFARRNRRRFSAPKLSLEASLLAIVGVLALGAFNVIDALWLELGAFPAFVERLCAQLAALFLALALIDAAFARAAFFRGLFLTRRAQREEQREAFGAPELRAARAKARQQLAFVDARGSAREQYVDARASAGKPYGEP